MFEIVTSGRPRAATAGAGGEAGDSQWTLVEKLPFGPLHEQYRYLRLFFGRFLANAAAPGGLPGEAGSRGLPALPSTKNGGGEAVRWLIPDAIGRLPVSQRIAQELCAFGLALQVFAHGVE